jgi:predicted ArsR family transcriptional regulator
VLESTAVVPGNPFRTSLRPAAEDISTISALDDPARRAVFEYVSRAGGEVGRDEAARALRTSRRAAASHLDRLAGEGLLDVSYRRLSGRSGPGAGRTSKLYRRSTRRVEVAIPARNYELLARALALGAGQGGRAAADQLRPASYEMGTRLGTWAREKDGRGADQPGTREQLQRELDELGFEPFVAEDGTMRLRNCPFHELARENSELVCGVNLALMEGITQGMELGHLAPALEPREGYCCVAFRADS